MYKKAFSEIAKVLAPIVFKAAIEKIFRKK